MPPAASERHCSTMQQQGDASSSRRRRRVRADARQPRNAGSTQAEETRQLREENADLRAQLDELKKVVPQASSMDHTGADSGSYAIQVTDTGAPPTIVDMDELSNSIVEQLLSHRAELIAGKSVVISGPSPLLAAPNNALNRALRRLAKQLPGCTWSVQKELGRAQVHLADVKRFMHFCEKQQASCDSFMGAWASRQPFEVQPSDMADVQSPSACASRQPHEELPDCQGNSRLGAWGNTLPRAELQGNGASRTYQDQEPSIALGVLGAELLCGNQLDPQVMLAPTATDGTPADGLLTDGSLNYFAGCGSGRDDDRQSEKLWISI